MVDQGGGGRIHQRFVWAPCTLQHLALRTLADKVLAWPAGTLPQPGPSKGTKVAQRKGKRGEGVSESDGTDISLASPPGLPWGNQPTKRGRIRAGKKNK